MRFGPLLQTDISILQEKLAAHGLTAEVSVSEEALAAEREELKNLPIRGKPTARAMRPHLLIDIPDEHVSVVAVELEKMGLTVGEIGEGDFTEEYHCPVCDYTSESQGFCPTHRVQMMDFLALQELKRQKPPGQPSIVRWVLTLAFLVVAAYVLFGRGRL